MDIPLTFVTMHELSIAQSIIELAEEKARERHALEIEELELEIGRLAGVELQTLDFALESAMKGTMLRNARIVRRYIEGKGRCSDCGTEFVTNELFAPCPSCGSWLIDIVKGKELRVKSIVIK